MFITLFFISDTKVSSHLFFGKDCMQMYFESAPNKLDIKNEQFAKMNLLSRGNFQFIWAESRGNFQERVHCVVMPLKCSVV